jgi:hypothetical protein
MAIYLFPIFGFGLVITGIVILGVKQASDLAKQIAAQGHVPSAELMNSKSTSSDSNPPSVKPLTGLNHL